MTPERVVLADGGRSVFCLVTPGALRAAHPTSPDARETTIVARAIAAIHAGIDLLQIREHNLPAQSLLRLVVRLVSASRGRSTRIVVNDRLDVALAAGADGVHLGGRSLPARRVRAIVPEGFLVGCSVHSVEEARAAAGEGAADYLVAGTVFPSASKPGATVFLGTDRLAAIAGAVAIPVLGVGGIGLDSLADVARTGAAGVAAIGLFEDAADLDATVRQARRLFDTARVIS
jgi:thiamine-phosphate pyrophosphorylase